MKKTVDKKDSGEANTSKQYAGVSVDIADDEKVNERDIKQETRLLNNNPRDND